MLTTEIRIDFAEAAREGGDSEAYLWVLWYHSPVGPIGPEEAQRAIERAAKSAGKDDLGLLIAGAESPDRSERMGTFADLLMLPALPLAGKDAGAGLDRSADWLVTVERHGMEALTLREAADAMGYWLRYADGRPDANLFRDKQVNIHPARLFTASKGLSIAHRAPLNGSWVNMLRAGL